MHGKKVYLIATNNIPAETDAYLKEAGYDVTVANDTDNAADVLCQTKYNLVLSSIDAITTALLDTAKKRGIPVMCLVKKGITESEVSALYAIGCVDYVTVPICKPALLARVKNQICVDAGKKRVNDANDYLYDFAFAVSHDMKNPYTSSEQLAEMLLHNSGDILNDDIRTILTHLSDFYAETRLIIESIADHAIAESRHRGGYLRRSSDEDIYA